MNIKRQRGRGRNKPTNNNPNRAYESTGPDIKVRGSAQTILEKYQQVGRDAMASGDRIIAENYMQHAEHYLRLLKSIQPHFVPRSELAITGIPSDNDDENENTDSNETEGENYAEGEEDDNEQSSNRNERYVRNDRNNNDRNNNRFNNNRNRGRDRYRNNRNEGSEGGETVSENSEANPEPQFEAVQAQIDDATPENNEENKARAPRGNSRLRSPLGRRPRPPKRDGEPKADKEPAGFGEDMPAFLATSVSE